MNRIYPGRPDGYLTERVAHAHREWLVEVADMNIAVHSGGEYSYLSEMIFGLRCLPSVMIGDWCCFYAKLDGTWND